MFVVYSAMVRLAGWSPRAWFRQVQEVMLMAFSTASSNATLPTSLRVAEQNLKLPNKVSRFVLTVGATANQNGTALFEGVTVLFLAQFFGVDLSLGQQFTVMFVCILGGIGTAGVPAGSLPVVALICAMVGVPPEGIGIILGVDRFLDMCRTTLNVTGDLMLATVVAKGEADERARPLAAPAEGRNRDSAGQGGTMGGPQPGGRFEESRRPAMTQPTERQLANAIRFLAADAVQAAKSGHPGMPMGMADIAEVLWRLSTATTRSTRTGPTATVSCCPTATARCCSTRCCTCPATTCRSRT
jgi:hypothetical protein